MDRLFRGPGYGSKLPNQSGMVDLEKLEEGAARRLISERLVEIANKEIEKIMSSLSLEEEQNAFYLV